MIRKYLLQGNIFKENILCNLILLSFPYILYETSFYVFFFVNIIVSYKLKIILRILLNF